MSKDTASDQPTPATTTPPPATPTEPSKATPTPIPSANPSPKALTRKEREELFHEIIKPFKERYLWLGEQYAEYILYAIASWHYSKIARLLNKVNVLGIRDWMNVGIYAESGALKSRVMRYFVEKLLPSDMAEYIGRITAAGFTGTVSGEDFSPPLAVEKQFLFVDEMGIITGSDKEGLYNIFLDYTEGHTGTVRLAKIVNYPYKAEVEKLYNGQIKFGKSSMKYWGDAVLIGATYKRQLLGDSAYQRRFKWVTPKYAITNAFIEEIDKKILEGVRLEHDKELIKQFQDNLFSPLGRLPTVKDVQLPSAVYKQNHKLTFSMTQSLMHYKLFRQYYWGIDVSDEDIPNELQRAIGFAREEVVKDTSDILLDYLYAHKEFDEKGFTAEQLIEAVAASKSVVYRFLKEYCVEDKNPLRPYPRIYHLG